jgi:exonuclease VII small subunit
MSYDKRIDDLNREIRDRAAQANSNSSLRQIVETLESIQLTLEKISEQLENI